MKLIAVLLLVLVFMGCNSEDKIISHNFSKVEIDVLYEDSISVRAIAVYNDTVLGFGFNKGYGFVNLNNGEVDTINFEGKDAVEQRAVGFTNTSFFSLGIGSPAKLRKVNLKSKKEEVVYTEVHDKVFYDAIAFWNDKEGIAIGDPTSNCLSVIITRDGGGTWDKVSCDDLPNTFEGEAAFAASNGNISIFKNHTWIVSGGMKSRVFYSPDKGKTWDVFETPILQGKPTTGAYSCHFYNKDHGVIYGGDYTAPKNNIGNKAITKDGGKTWKLISDASGPGYKSCVRYVPYGGGKEMVAVGFTGIAITNDFGVNWKELSKEGFYTIRFINNSVAIAAGKGRLAKVTFK